MAHTSSDFNSDKVEDRFYQSGKICKGLHLVDLYMYDSSLFGNVMIVEDEDFTLIIDAGTSDSAGSIVNYLEFHDINLKITVVLPTHHHFDHIGGLPRLMDFLSKKSAKTFVLAPEKMHSLLLSPESYAKSAKKGFDGVVGDLSPLDSKFVRNLLPNNHYKLGDGWTMEVIETPGHCDDHVSPVLTNSKDQRI